MNRRQQGDLGEASAIEWLTSKGATVLIPFGHSPQFDLVAEVEGKLLRIQVKASTQETKTPDGHQRFPVSLVTCGGNQSWTGVSKRIDPSRFDYLFALTARGRRWLIPSASLEARNAISLGGPKYGECEIEPGRPIRGIVYGDAATLESTEPGGVSKRTTDRGCKPRGSTPSEVRILPPPLPSLGPVKPTRYERKLGQNGQAVINQKRRITIPQRPFFEASFANGSRVRVSSDGPGRIVLEQIELPAWARANAEQLVISNNGDE